LLHPQEGKVPDSSGNRKVIALATLGSLGDLNLQHPCKASTVSPVNTAPWPQCGCCLQFSRETNDEAAACGANLREMHIEW
jgi:hypothetical protein